MIKIAQPIFIVGLGKTGFACLNFLTEKNIPFTVIDSRDNPPYLQKTQQKFPDVHIKTGSLNDADLHNAATLILSPGVNPKEENISRAMQNGAAVIGDIELFAIWNNTPVIAITGSNGKSTVTKLTALLLQAVGKRIAMGGNIGTPALELLAQPQADFTILELSSFQLDSTLSLQPVVSVILNISPDHLDRYELFEQYVLSKLRIMQPTSIAVIPQYQAWNIPKVRKKICFGFSQENEFNIQKINNKYWVSVSKEPWMALSEVRLSGKHNWLNVLAALTIIRAVGISISGENKNKLQQVLKQYAGLPHRCETIASQDDILWVNDSKATNVGSTLAAIESFAETFYKKIVLIVGGDAKNADLTPLKISIENNVYRLIALGRDGYKIAQLINKVPTSIVASMEQAVAKAAEIVPENGMVLLSPACSSLDMFESFEERGNIFSAAVRRMAA